MADRMRVSADTLARENRVPPPGKLHGARYRRPEGYRVQRSAGTKDYYFTFTVSGGGWFSNGEQTVTCGPGDAVLVVPGTPHYYGTVVGSLWDFYWCHFVPQDDWLPMLRLPEPARGIRLLTIYSPTLRIRISTAFSRLVKSCKEPGPFSEKLTANALEELLLLVARVFAEEPRPLDSRIASALERMARSFRERLTVAELARTVHLSPSRFAHLFKEQTGKSVMETLAHYRLQYAKEQLETTDRSIADIAAELGFSNSFHFSRKFSSFFGMPPSIYRKMARGDKS